MTIRGSRILLGILLGLSPALAAAQDLTPRAYFPAPEKSNAVILAVDAALADVRAGLAGPVPPALRDVHYGGAGKVGSGVGYVYPHDSPGGVAPQQYPPDAVLPRTYYRPTRHGAESRLAYLSHLLIANRHSLISDAKTCLWRGLKPRATSCATRKRKTL